MTADKVLRRWKATRSAIRALNESGSRTSRTHIQKLLYFANVWNIGNVPPFEFVLYDHGPYSFELDRTLLLMESFNAFTRVADPDGFGSRYSVEGEGKEEVSSAPLIRLAKWLGPLGVRDLEARATCEFLRNEGSKDVRTHIKRIKPHLSEDEIAEALSGIEKMRKELKVR